MAYYPTCGGEIAITMKLIVWILLQKHNTDRTFAGTPGSTDTVNLNGHISLTVEKEYNYITSSVNDFPLSGGASRVGGAEYYIDIDPGNGKGIPMDPLDNYYDAVNGNWKV